MSRQWGKSFDVWEESRKVLDQAGFLEIVDGRCRWPILGWPADPQLNHLGEMNQMRLTDNMEAFTIRLTRHGSARWTLSLPTLRKLIDESSNEI